MVTTTFVLAASGLFALTHGAPVSLHSESSKRSLVERDNIGSAYNLYAGDGTTAKGWPDEKSWKSFDELWKINEPVLEKSCGWGSGGTIPDNSKQEIADIQTGIKAAAQSSHISEAFILAIIMQESKGCVRVKPTLGSVNNPGLMQDHDGQAMCNDGRGSIQNPCPADTIKKMIMEGVAGTASGEGIQGAIQRTGASDSSKYYKGARNYNSGSIDPSGNLGKGIATHCYSSDVANRLMGWVDGGSTCVEGQVGNQDSSSGGSKNNNNSPSSSTAPPSGSASNSPSSPTATTAPATPTGTTQNNQSPKPDSQPTAPKAPGASTSCQEWYEVKKGDTCSSIETGLGKPGALVRLNSGLDQTCNNLMAGFSYCVSAN